MAIPDIKTGTVTGSDTLIIEGVPASNGDVIVCVSVHEPSIQANMDIASVARGEVSGTVITGSQAENPIFRSVLIHLTGDMANGDVVVTFAGSIFGAVGVALTYNRKFTVVDSDQENHTGGAPTSTHSITVDDATLALAFSRLAAEKVITLSDEELLQQLFSPDSPHMIAVQSREPADSTPNTLTASWTGDAASVVSGVALFEIEPPPANGGALSGVALSTAENGAGDFAWTDPANALADDTDYASRSLSSAQTSNRLHALQPANGGTFEGVPDEAVIHSLKLRVRRYKSGSPTVFDSEFRVLNSGTAVGPNKAKTETGWTAEAVTARYQFTADDLDGMTVGELRASNSGVALSASYGTGFGSVEARVEYIEIEEMQYLEPPAGVGNAPISLLLLG